MRVLLDSHILIWLMAGDVRLTSKARTLITGADAVYASTASFWELSIKVGVGKLRLDVERLADLLDAAGISELLVKRQHVLGVAKLPLLHKDPFDRLLVVQAITERMNFVTADRKLAPYSRLVTVV